MKRKQSSFEDIVYIVAHLFESKLFRILTLCQLIKRNVNW